MFSSSYLVIDLDESSIHSDTSTVLAEPTKMVAMNLSSRPQSRFKSFPGYRKRKTTRAADLHPHRLVTELRPVILAGEMAI